MTKEIAEKVKEFVKKEFVNPQRDKDSYEEHFIPVVKYSLQLAEQQNADKEIAELASWLHDMGAVRGDYENHHISGAKIAEELLSNLNYPSEKIEQVKKCILNHRGSMSEKRQSKEEQILADADALAHFDDIKGLVKGEYGNSEPEKEAKKKVLEKLERSYLKLSDKAKPLVKDKLEQARKELS